MQKIKQLFKNKYFIIALIVFIFGVSVNQISSVYLKNKFGDSLPVLNDLILDNIPFFNVIWLFDLLSLASVLLFIIYAYKKEFKNIPFIILTFGIFQFIRGCFIGLTPFGSPKIIDVGLFVGTSFKMGVYPSGHVGTSFLAFLFSKGKWKIIFLLLTIGIIVTLLLGRGHYSIDIFSAVLFSYAIYCFSIKYFKNKFELLFKKAKD